MLRDVRAAPESRSSSMTTLKTLRADTVGSLLRPEPLKAERRRFDRGDASDDSLRAAEDAAIREVVAMQESVGLEAVTDGELRRLNFQDSFGAAVEGFDAGRGSLESMERAAEDATPLRRYEKKPTEGGPVAMSHRAGLTSRLRLVRNVVLEEFRFLESLAESTPKMTLVSPDRVSQRVALEDSDDVYADADELLADVIDIEGQMIDQVVEAGCSYVQLDAPGYTAYVDEESLARMRARGEDPAASLARSIAADNALVEHIGDATSAIHVCRGNNRSMWHREGHYDAVAEQLFGSLRHDRLFLEYDSERAGSFEPLRYVREDTVVVLGLVSTKTPDLETVDGLTARIEAASRYVDIDRLAISPQCGFASSAVGNLISADDQRRKLEVVVETAARVWG